MVDFSNVQPSHNVVDLRPAPYSLEAEGDFGSDRNIMLWIDDLLRNHPEKRDIIASWLYHQDYPVTTGGPETGATGLNQDYIDAILEKKPDLNIFKSRDNEAMDQEFLDMILNIFPRLRGDQ